MDQPTPFNPNPPIPGHDPSPDPAPVPVCLVSGPASASIPPAGSDDPAESASDRCVSVGVSGGLRVPLLLKPTVDPDHLRAIHPECSIDHLGTTVLYLTLRDILWKQSHLLGRMDEVEEAAGLIARFLLPYRDESRQEYLTRMALMLPLEP